MLLLQLLSRNSDVLGKDWLLPRAVKIGAEQGQSLRKSLFCDNLDEFSSGKLESCPVFEM